VCPACITTGEKEIVIMASIADRTILVTGGNRGIGRALAEEALNRGAALVYAGTRGPLAHADRRVTPLMLDVTDAAQIQADSWRSGAVKAFERQLAAVVEAEPVTS
jgi:NAD(P)-dependent dehydrogenase (short-subunit alcohol dehydrogenase family)